MFELIVSIYLILLKLCDSLLPFQNTFFFQKLPIHSTDGGNACFFTQGHASIEICLTCG